MKRITLKVLLNINKRIFNNFIDSNLRLISLSKLNSDHHSSLIYY